MRHRLLTQDRKVVVPLAYETSPPTCCFGGVLSGGLEIDSTPRCFGVRDQDDQTQDVYGEMPLNSPDAPSNGSGSELVYNARNTARGEPA
jgi:hypothetical protein